MDIAFRQALVCNLQAQIDRLIKVPEKTRSTIPDKYHFLPICIAICQSEIYQMKDKEVSVIIGRTNGSVIPKPQNGDSLTQPTYRGLMPIIFRENRLQMATIINGEFSYPIKDSARSG